MSPRDSSQTVVHKSLSALDLKIQLKWYVQACPKQTTGLEARRQLIACVCNDNNNANNNYNNSHFKDTQHHPITDSLSRRDSASKQGTTVLTCCKQICCSMYYIPIPAALWLAVCTRYMCKTQTLLRWSVCLYNVLPACVSSPSITCAIL